MYRSHYFPKSAELDMLYVIPRAGLSNYERILLCSMQGITAKEKTCIRVEMNNPNYSI